MSRTTLSLGAAILGLAFASSANAADYWNPNLQREQIHQRYLTPAEHQSLHRGSNWNGWNNNWNSTPNLRYRYNSGYGWNGYGSSSWGATTSPIYTNPSWGVPIQTYPYGSSYPYGTSYPYLNNGYCR